MKKKHFAALLLVLLLALGTSAQVLADEPDAEGELRDEPPKEGVFQEGSFSGPQTIPGEPMAVAESWEEDLKAMILEGWTARKKEVDISSLRIPKSELNRYWDVLHTLQNDHPELFYVGIDSVWNNGTIFVRQDLTYRTIEGGLDKAISDFNAAANEALSQIQGLTDPVEIALVLHDWLVLKCEYNWTVAQVGGNPGNSPDPYVASGMPWTAYGAMAKGDAVCQGYALAYKYLLGQASIPCVYISSSAMNHAWNGVQIDGNWYQVDATWDDPTINREGRVRHAYFLLSDETFGTTGQHYGWDKIVTCNSKTYESGYVFVGNDHPVYRRNGSFYYIKPETASNYSCISVYRTASLSSGGTRLANGLGLSNNAVVLWVDSRLYVLPGPFSNQVNEKVLLVYDLDNGVTAQAGRFTHSPAASPDGLASAGSDDYPGLRYNAQTNEIEAVSCTRRQTVYSVPAVSLPASWSGASTGSAAAAVIGGSDEAAAVLWGVNAPGGLTLWAAYYDGNGKMVSAQVAGRDEIVPANISNVRPKMVLAYLDAPRSYASAKLMLLTEEQTPICAAAS